MKRKPGLSKPHTFLSLALVTISLMTIGYSSWVISSGSDGVVYGNTDGTDRIESEVANSGKEVTMNFETTVDSSSLASGVSTANSYDNWKLEAKLDYTENESYPLADNFEISDPTNPYGGVADSDRNEFRNRIQFRKPLHIVN